MVAVIDELERHGLAERRPHPDDRRARAIYLTTAGEESLKRVRAVAARLQRELFAPLTSQERDTFTSLLAKLAMGAPATKLAAAEPPVPGVQAGKDAGASANGDASPDAPSDAMRSSAVRRRRA
jgi:hypothetical protein